MLLLVGVIFRSKSRKVFVGSLFRYIFSIGCKKRILAHRYNQIAEGEE